MDNFIAKMNARLGGGGVHCSCCNGFRSAHKNRKAMLNRITRAEMKEELYSIVYEELDNSEVLDEVYGG